ncbi:MAG: AbrB/MazE/SpoVT family DNA-binding domain-containing protein [Chloroflexi bacterium]|nr:AbrB/MazE/SpoVT family DNA-binding domain-containing protein [Chloroflexota bacterium]
MREIITRVTSKGQVTIPVEIRRALGLKARDRVAFTLVDGAATVRRAESVIDELFGSVKYDGPPLDFRKLRREFEDDMAREVWREMGLGQR